jgi:GST-like protein
MNETDGARYTLYSAPTPNGHKVSIALEELGLAYRLVEVDLGAQAQKHPDFLAKNRNGRIPVLIDHSAGDLAIAESGAILIHLAEATGRLLPLTQPGRARTLQWLMFQMSAQGPMQGQANHFARFAPEDVPYAKRRYLDETRRIYGVLDARLGETKMLAGDDLTIADLATWPWVHALAWTGLDLGPFPHVARWYRAIAARPSVTRGLSQPPIPERWRMGSPLPAEPTPSTAQ